MATSHIHTSSFRTRRGREALNPPPPSRWVAIAHRLPAVALLIAVGATLYGLAWSVVELTTPTVRPAGGAR